MKPERNRVKCISFVVMLVQAVKFTMSISIGVGASTNLTPQ